jgi:hypothetical protein
MFTASVRSQVPALVRSLRELRGVDKTLRAHAIAHDGRLVVHSRSAFDGRFRPLFSGKAKSTLALYERGESLRAAIAALREQTPVDA